jgi:peptidoglycan/LPS O-acetylase OafA/YrhL
MYAGKSSSGIYVVHFFTPEIVEWACWQVGLPITPMLPIRFVIFSIVTVLIASVSWYCFEKPLNNLKQ